MTLSPISKGDLAFLCLPAGAGAAAAVVDVSEQRTSITNNTSYVSETASARTAIAAPRTICVVVDMTSTSSGRLIQHGSGASAYGYAINKTGTSIACAENNLGRITVTVPGLTAVARKVLVHWAQRVEGASVVSECAVYNFFTLEWNFGSAVHAAYAPLATDKLTIGASSTGSSAYSLSMTAFHAVSIGRRFHSTTETSLDFVSTPTPPTMLGRRRTPLPTGVAASLAIVGDGQFAGPQYLMALAATRESDSRLVTPLVNIVVANPTSEVLAPTARYKRAAPGAPTYRLSTRWLWCAVPGPKVNAARCRIHVAVTGTGGVCPIYFRLYSLANLPMGQVNPPQLVSYFSPTVSIAASTGAAGVVLDLGMVRLARDDAGLTALALALDFNHGGGDAFATNVKIRAVSIEPYSADLSGGGFGDVDDKEGY
ncbi:MAG TPA: hypothetical protein VGB85_00105 [Nannocystis sp.]|jgi:hypothetical protein